MDLKSGGSLLHEIETIEPLKHYRVTTPQGTTHDVRILPGGGPPQCEPCGGTAYEIAAYQDDCRVAAAERPGEWFFADCVRCGTRLADARAPV